ncbi:MAG: hypothetical protein ABS882_10990, partial [Lysinibacillus sp.]
SQRTRSLDLRLAERGRFEEPFHAATERLSIIWSRKTVRHSGTMNGIVDALNRIASSPRLKVHVR